MWRGMGGACHCGMVQDQLPAFRNSDALISVDQFKISEADVLSFFDEQCGVSFSGFSVGLCINEEVIWYQLYLGK